MGLPKRQLNNWLHGLAHFVEDTESPRHFWVWAGLYCLSSAMQRRCWLPYGMETIYPNLYIMIVAPPGWSRKGSPVGFAKRILTNEGVQIPVFVDSPTKRALTKTLDELSSTQHFKVLRSDGSLEMRAQSPLALISKELSSFLATDPKGMIEALTDLFDSHDVWEYKTSEKGADKLYGVCVGCFFASTPTWIANNLPVNAVGDGFTSRFIMTYGDQPYKEVAIPTKPDNILYDKLVSDLATVTELSGPFAWGEGTEKLFKDWYSTIRSQKAKNTHDERILAYLARIHIQVLKTAMALHVARSNELILELKDLEMAISLCEQVIEEAPKAYGVFAASQGAKNTHDLMVQLKVLASLNPVSFTELLKINYTKMTRMEMIEALESLEAMGCIRREYETLTSGKMKEYIRWIGRKDGV